MKKFFLLLLISIYSFASTNAAVYIHYCCGWVESISLENQASSQVPESCHVPVTNKKTAKDCCEDKEVSLDVVDHALSSKTDSLVKLFPILLSGYSFAENHHLRSFQEIGIQTYNPPPPKANTPPYIFLCTYRI